MSRWSVAPDTVHTDLPDGSVVVLALGSKQYHTLNESAALVWRALAVQPRETRELVELLVTEYEVEPETARADLERVLESWLGDGLARHP
ncbi:MAG: PqqD family protein [Polyangiaceae bacterium]|nr:PqqD family protein [Polyangiaceae bacterium]